MLVLFLFLRGIYTYPLKRVAKIIGSLSLVASVVFIALVIILNYDDDISGRSVNQYYHPLVYGTMNGIYLACFQGIIHCITSGMVIYGAAKEQRFFLIPWLFKMLVSIGLNIYWMIACLAANVYPSYYLVYLAFAIIQSQVTTSVFIHFRELTEAKLGGLESQLPYGKMTNSVA